MYNIMEKMIRTHTMWMTVSEYNTYANTKREPNKIRVQDKPVVVRTHIFFK